MTNTGATARKTPKWYNFIYVCCGAMLGSEVAQWDSRPVNWPLIALAAALLGLVVAHRYGQRWLSFTAWGVAGLSTFWVFYKEFA